MFLDTCIISTTIARILKLDMGHVLLLGTTGKGRNSLARLGGYLTGFKMFEAGLNQEYIMRLWQDDLKKVLMNCGIEKN